MTDLCLTPEPLKGNGIDHPPNKTAIQSLLVYNDLFKIQKSISPVFTTVYSNFTEWYFSHTLLFLQGILGY